MMNRREALKRLLAGTILAGTPMVVDAIPSNEGPQDGDVLIWSDAGMRWKHSLDPGPFARQYQGFSRQSAEGSTAATAATRPNARARARARGG